MEQTVAYFGVLYQNLFEELKKTTKISVGIIREPPEIGTRHFTIISRTRYHISSVQ
jgi:hypothetical protein